MRCLVRVRLHFPVHVVHDSHRIELISGCFSSRHLFTLVHPRAVGESLAVRRLLAEIADSDHHPVRP